jgi:hypothetical protein
MNTATKNALINFLTENGPELIDFKYFLESETFDSFDEVRDLIDAGDGFNIEIIYYSAALDYLRENDPSLRQSLELAGDMGYEPKNLSSEILASILATEIVRGEFNDLENEFTDLLEELTAAEQTEEEEEA